MFAEMLDTGLTGHALISLAPLLPVGCRYASRLAFDVEAPKGQDAVKTDSPNPNR